MAPQPDDANTNLYDDILSIYLYRPEIIIAQEMDALESFILD